MLTRFLVALVFLLAIVSTAAITALYVSKNNGGGKVIVQQAAPSPVAPAAGPSGDDAIKAYLEKNPDIASAIVQKQQQEAQAKADAAAANAIKNKINEYERDPKNPVVGNPRGDVTLVKFSDYNCGFCKKAAKDIVDLLAEDTNLRVVMKDYPILGERSQINAKAALAFWNLNKHRYFDFHNALLEKGAKTDEQLYALAAEYGVASADLKRVMNSEDIQATIDRNSALAKEIQIFGTPSFLVGGEIIRGALGVQAFKDAIAKARGR